MNKEVYHEGWLIKSPPTKRIWRARWRRRWFTLKQGEIPGQFCLEYYTDRNCRKLKGVIDLDQCEQVDSGLRLEHRKQKFQFMFDIKTPRRTYYLAADSENDMRDWVNCICQVCNLHDFTKPGERQYYNLLKNDASTVSVENTSSIVLNASNDTYLTNISNSLSQSDNNKIEFDSDIICHTEGISLNSVNQNNDLAYVNTEYTNQETLQCDKGLKKDKINTNQINDNLTVGILERSKSLRNNSLSYDEVIIPKHIRSQSLNESTEVKISSNNATTKKIPENLVLCNNLIEEKVEPSPALSTCSGPYIPISECFSGSPKFLNNENPTTPLNNLDPKFYDTPRSHNNIGLNLTYDQSSSPKIYNCPQHMRTRSGRSSPTDSESVFTDDEEWTHTVPLRESSDRNLRPSESSIENDSIVFTYTQRFSKIPDETKNQNEVNSKNNSLNRKNNLFLDTTCEETRIRELQQLSDTENTSPAIGPKDSVEENYDIPRSHHLPYYNMNHLNQNSGSPSFDITDKITSSTPNLLSEHEDVLSSSNSKTLPRPHFYTNAAPTKIEGNVFRYDFFEQGDAPVVNRSLKPKITLEEKTHEECPLKPPMPLISNTNESSLVRPPSIDRKLKPATAKIFPITTTNNRRRIAPMSLVISNDTDFSINHKDLETRTLPRNASVGNTNCDYLLKYNSSFAKSNSQLQYFDLDVANPPTPINRGSVLNNSMITNISKINPSTELNSRTSPKSGVVYNSVDFVKTEAFKRIREDAEKNRRKD